MPKLFRVILPVADIELAKTFYSLVLEMPGERVSRAAITSIAAAPCSLATTRSPMAMSAKMVGSITPDSMSISLFPISIKPTSALQAGATIVEGGIQRMPWGERHVLGERPVR